jgi:hypothetical protein
MGIYSEAGVWGKARQYNEGYWLCQLIVVAVLFFAMVLVVAGSQATTASAEAGCVVTYQPRPGVCPFACTTPGLTIRQEWPGRWASSCICSPALEEISGAEWSDESGAMSCTERNIKKKLGVF